MVGGVAEQGKKDTTKAQVPQTTKVFVVVVVLRAHARQCVFLSSLPYAHLIPMKVEEGKYLSDEEQ